MPFFCLRGELCSSLTRATKGFATYKSEQNGIYKDFTVLKSYSYLEKSTANIQRLT